jgi:hypothetical protein
VVDSAPPKGPARVPTRPVKVLLIVSVVMAALIALKLMSGGPILRLGFAPDQGPDEAAAPSAAAPPEHSTGFARTTPFVAPVVDALEANDDPDLPDASIVAGVQALTVAVVDFADRPVAGVPVVLLGGRADATTLAGPKYTGSAGRARFPIDVALERESDVVVAARAIPGGAVWTTTKAALDRPADVTLKIDAGLAASVRLLEPEGGVYAGRARVRKVVVDEPAPETGERGLQLTAAFREASPRSIRVGDAHLFVGLVPGESFTLYGWAPGFEPAFLPVQVPEQPARPLPIEATLGRRLAAVTFVAATPEVGDAAEVSYGCRAATEHELVVLSGADDLPSQRAPEFRREVAPGAAQRLRVDAYRGGASIAAAEFDVPALRPGETFDAGRILLAPLGVVLAGRVTDLEERPLPGAAVEALPAGDARELTAETDAAGRFVLRGLTGRGPYQVAAHAKGRVAERRADVAEGATDLRIALEPAGAVVGGVVLPAGTSPDRVRVRALRNDRAPTATSLAADGTFRLSELASGVYVLVIDGPEIQPLRVGAVVVAAPETNSEDRLRNLAPLPAQRGQP